MTKDEALKLALEALQWNWGGEPLPTLELQAINAIKEALAQQEQEPVAIKRMKEWIEYLKRKSDFGQHMKIPSEMSAGTCWELALELEQFINTHPPQRTWIGLTEEEKHQLNNALNLQGRFPIIDAIEAKLRGKNGG